MRRAGHIFSFVFALFFLLIATEHRLMAYADPGSGAMFVQIIFAAAIGIGLKIRGRLTRFFRSKDQSTDELQNRNPTTSG